VACLFVPPEGPAVASRSLEKISHREKGAIAGGPHVGEVTGLIPGDDIGGIHLPMAPGPVQARAAVPVSIAEEVREIIRLQQDGTGRV
jgi:hypothetical protein